MIDIRQAHKEDYKIIAFIVNEAWKTAYKGMVPQKDMLHYTDISRREQIVKNFYKEGKLKYFIAKLDGKDCGVISYKPYEGDRFENCAYIMQLYVLPSYHRQGVGKALMEFIEAETKKQGYNMLFLNTLEDNKKARAFYEKLGFEYCGEEDSPVFSERVVRALYRKDL